MMVLSNKRALAGFAGPYKRRRIWFLLKGISEITIGWCLR